MEPFNLLAAQKGITLLTRNKKPVRLITVALTPIPAPIIAEVFDHRTKGEKPEDVYYMENFFPDGSYLGNGIEHENDLFIQTL